MRPRAYIRRGRSPSTHTVVACIGDSITHAVISADYVALLQDDFASDGYEFVNAGMSGDLAYNALQRLDEVIACRPDVVTVLVGTNDVAAHVSDSWRKGYMRLQHLPQPPTLDWYQQVLEQIVVRIQAETEARIALIQIPILGEDLGSPHNLRVDRYNEAVRDIAAKNKVSLLPLRDKMVENLPSEHTPPVFDGTRRPMVRAVLRRFLLRQSWDEISASAQLTLLTDYVHLNDCAAQIVAAEITRFLRQTAG